MATNLNNALNGATNLLATEDITSSYNGNSLKDFILECVDEKKDEKVDEDETVGKENE